MFAFLAGEFWFIISHFSNITFQGLLSSLREMYLSMQVFYLDNLDFGQLNTDHQLRPRYKDFGPEIVKELVSHDKVDNDRTGSCVFGRTKVA